MSDWTREYVPDAASVIGGLTRSTATPSSGPGGAPGIPADLAAVELIARHDHFLHQPAFRRIIAATPSPFTIEPSAVIRWQAAITA